MRVYTDTQTLQVLVIAKL